MANMRSIVSLQQLLIEVLTNIIQKVGKASYADYCNLRAPCKIMKEASNSPVVLHSPCLSPLVKKPLCALQHLAIRDKCIEHENCAAFFVQGILTYFVESDDENGMVYLHNAAIGEGDNEILEAAYLYCVLRFLHGDPLRDPFDEMAFKKWREDEEDLVARVWKNLRKTLYGITVRKKQVYVRSMKNSKPVTCSRYGNNLPRQLYVQTETLRDNRGRPYGLDSLENTLVNGKHKHVGGDSSFQVLQQQLQESKQQIAEQAAYNAHREKEMAKIAAQQQTKIDHLSLVEKFFCETDPAFCDFMDS